MIWGYFGNLDEFHEFDLKSNVNDVSLTTGTGLMIYPLQTCYKYRVYSIPCHSVLPPGRCSPVLNSLFLKSFATRNSSLLLLMHLARCIFLAMFTKALPTSIYNFSAEECAFGCCFFSRTGNVSLE